jgi:hypothetical protein
LIIVVINIIEMNYFNKFILECIIVIKFIETYYKILLQLILLLTIQ